MDHPKIIEEIKQTQANIDRLLSRVKLDGEQQELISHMSHIVLLYQQAMIIAMEEKEAEIKNLNAGLIYLENFLKQRDLLADFLQYLGEVCAKRKSPEARQ